MIDTQNSSTAYVVMYNLITQFLLDKNRRMGALITPMAPAHPLHTIKAGRGMSAEICGLNDVLLPGDLGSSPLTPFIIYIPYIIDALWVIKISSLLEAYISKVGVAMMVCCLIWYTLSFLFGVTRVFKWYISGFSIESTKTTSMEDVSTGVLEKIKKILEVMIKSKNDMMYQDIYNCICQNTKKWRFTIQYVKPTAQLVFKNRFPKGGPTCRRKLLIHDTKRCKDNQLQSLKLPCRISIE